MPQQAGIRLLRFVLDLNVDALKHSLDKAVVLLLVLLQLNQLDLVDQDIKHLRPNKHEVLRGRLTL
jgi:hypothetical protein